MIMIEWSHGKPLDIQSIMSDLNISQVIYQEKYTFDLVIASSGISLIEALGLFPIYGLNSSFLYSSGFKVTVVICNSIGYR